MSRQYTLPLPHREVMGADDFMVTDSNKDAVAWLDRWPDWSTHCLVLNGPSGSGKTHLLQVWLNKSQGRLLSLEELATARLRDLGDQNNIAVDNADQIMGQAGCEEALFHLYNIVREVRGFLLLTASTAPAQWNIQLPDLRSRLLSVPLATLAAPDDALITSLLIKQFGDRQIDISLEVVDYLLPRLTRTPDAVRRCVADLDRISLAEGRKITTALVRQWLETIPAS